LLNDAELRSLGIKDNYGVAVSRAGIEFVHYPIVEGAGAGDHTGTMQAAHAVVASVALIMQRDENSVMHCRGGVGRAGMMAACLLLFSREATAPKQAISLVRKRRCKQAVETRRQEDFVKRYYTWLIETGILDASPSAAVVTTAGAAETGQDSTVSGESSVAERKVAAEKRRQQAKERRAATRANAKDGGASCSGKTGCTCAACATSAAIVGRA
jgi:hypothetical protein